jgi:hypothetical protein
MAGRLPIVIVAATAPSSAARLTGSTIAARFSACTVAAVLSATGIIALALPASSVSAGNFGTISTLPTAV